MDSQLIQFVELLRDAEEDPEAARRALADNANWIAAADEAQLADLLDAILVDSGSFSDAQERLLAVAFALLVQRQMRSGAAPLPAAVVDRILLLHSRLGPQSRVRHMLLQWLAAAGGERELHEFAAMLAAEPPADAEAVAQAMAPLFQNPDCDPAPLFPTLLGGLAYYSAAAAILDLSNFVVRSGKLADHPARDRSQQLASLLDQIVRRLEIMEETPQAAGKSAEQLSRQVSESVAIAVSLCDALALIGDRSVVGALQRALALKHRRLRTEAASALAALGQEQGETALLELAAEPVARLRVLKYAEELGIAERLDPQFQTSAAQAEAELALWLAQPSQIGLPPTGIELLDERSLYWPGYDDPVDCFLFRFWYDLGDRSYSNIGIAGPLTHALAADMADLPCDDIYAAFAGWQAQHEDIYEFAADRLNEAERVEVSRLERRLRDAGFHDIRPLTLGYFFGQRVLVAAVKNEGAEGVAVADNAESLWFPTANRPRPLSASEAYCIYKGRKLLRSFNDEEM